MGDVIQFLPRARSSRVVPPSPGSSDPSRGISSVLACGPAWQDLVHAAQPLLALLRDSYGLTVMLQGLPRDRDALASALVTLLRAVRLVESVYGRQHATVPVAVYLGKAELEWFDDGYGENSALAVPTRIEPEQLAEALVRRGGNP